MTRPIEGFRERDEVLVLKLGSSVLREDADLPRAVHAVYAHVRAGRRVVVVVSAIGDTTDALLDRGDALDAAPASPHLAALVATGEDASAALFALALERAGLVASRLDARALDLRVDGPRDDAYPVSLDPDVLRAAVVAHDVVVVPGFLGLDERGVLALLGRGGSDLTALFLAKALQDEREAFAGVRCRLAKDVDGLFERDPATLPPPRRFAEASYADAYRVAEAGGIVQPKAVRFAERHAVAFEVGHAEGEGGTRVAAERSRLDGGIPALVRPGEPVLRVALAGLGTVGGGVAQRLSETPGFEVTAALVRDPARRRDPALESVPLVSDVDTLFATAPDVVVEVLGGTTRAVDVVERALAEGLDVVTANKAALATHVDAWEALALRHGVTLSYAAAVGGAVPILERIRGVRGEGVTSVEAVLNGTSSFVLDRVAAGLDLATAIREAQALGLAEADPSFDVDGTDALQKLLLVSRAAFDRLPERVERRGLDSIDPLAVRQVTAAGGAARLVARLRADAGVLEASVQPALLDPDHPFARARTSTAGARLARATGRTVTIHGQGAGRWPTTEAVVADLLALRARGSRALLAS